MYSSKHTIKKKIIQEVRELTLVIKYCFWQIKIHLVFGNPFLLKDGSKLMAMWKSHLLWQETFNSELEF